MADEVTSGFSTIEEDASLATDPEQHLKIELKDFLGGSDTGLNTYLNLGSWAPSTIAGTVSGGELVDAVADLASAFTKDTNTGDDLLAAFIQNTYLDDARDRFDDAVTDDKNAKPSVDFSKFAQTPRLAAVSAAAALTDGTDLFPGSNDDPTGPFYLSQRARRAVTKRLPSLVGWRDHTEGHRISTTRGDKIEIVAGNYKLISLGRGAGTVQTEWSGGHVVNALEAPGNVTSINWRPVPTVADEPGWQWVEETVKGNVIERFHGTYRTEHYGDEVIEIIGRSDEDAPIATVTATSETADQTGSFDDVSDAEEENNRWDAPGGLAPTSRPRPRMVSKIFGQFGYDQTHATGALIDIEHADELHDFVGCEPNLDEEGNVQTEGQSLNFKGEGPAFDDVLLREASNNSRPDLVREHVVADRFETIKVAENVLERTNSNQLISIKTGIDGGTVKASEVWKSNFVESFVGLKAQLFLGSYFTYEQIHTEVFVGAELHANAGMVLDLSILRLKGNFVSELKHTLTENELLCAEASAALFCAELALAEQNTTVTSLNVHASNRMS